MWGKAMICVFLKRVLPKRVHEMTSKDEQSVSRIGDKKHENNK
jgi:hypothetical protein